MDATVETSQRFVPRRRDGLITRLFDSKPFLVTLCLLPSLGLLVVFLTYPLGLGLWLSLTDTTIGQRGDFIGLENFELLFDDPVFWNAVWYTIFYTAIATAGKFILGLWLALLLNNHMPFKAFIRAIVLLPWIVPTVLSSIAWWFLPPIRSASTPKSNRQIDPLRIATEDNHANCESEIANSS